MTHNLAHELKQSGFPQPSPKVGQVWFHDDRTAHLILNRVEWSGFCQTAFVFDEVAALGMFSPKGISEMTFAPSLDDITPHLPPTFALEIWDGKPSCAIWIDGAHTRTFGDTFAEAAGRMWLEIKKQGI